MHSNGAHVSIISVIAIRMMQADVNTETDTVILWVPPAGIDDLVCIRRSVNGTIGDSIIHAVMSVVPDPTTKAVGPVTTTACITYARLRRWRSRRRRHRTIFVRYIAGVCNDAIVSCVVG